MWEFIALVIKEKHRRWLRWNTVSFSFCVPFGSTCQDMLQNPCGSVPWRMRKLKQGLSMGEGENSVPFSRVTWKGGMISLLRHMAEELAMANILLPNYLEEKKKEATLVLLNWESFWVSPTAFFQFQWNVRGESNIQVFAKCWVWSLCLPCSFLYS